MQPNTQPLVIEGAIERANHLILEFLKVGPGSAREILAAAEGAKISERTIQRAAISLGVVKAKAGFNGGWTWRLPADEVGITDAPMEQPAQVAAQGEDGKVTGRDTEVSLRETTESPRGTGKVAARVENIEPVKDRDVSEPSRANVIAARLRHLEEIRGRKAPIYAQDSRVMRWAELGVRDPDIREAYERAVTALEDARSQSFVSVGFLDQVVMQVISEGDKA
jgi:hypothetical protein